MPASCGRLRAAASERHLQVIARARRRRTADAGHARAHVMIEGPEPCIVARYISLFFNDTATTEIYTLSLHDALPIWPRSTSSPRAGFRGACQVQERGRRTARHPVAPSTRRRSGLEASTRGGAPHAPSSAAVA